MFPLRSTFLLLNAFLATTCTYAASDAVKGYVIISSTTKCISTQVVFNITFRSSTVNLRIEANSSTLWEGLITSGPRNISSGGGGEGEPSYPCEGGPYQPPPAKTGNTATDAMDEASKRRGFTYHSFYYEEDYDFEIDRIGPSSETFISATNTNYIWGSLINYQLSPARQQLGLCGCQDVLKTGDEVLWAFITLPDFEDYVTAPNVSFLKLTPTAVTVKKGQGTTVTVIDGRSGNKTRGASVAGVKTNADGKATLYFSKPGFYQFKAHRTGDVRSNAMNITVTK